MKKVKRIIPAFDIDMGGIIIQQALPTNNVDQVDPFLLLHHGRIEFQKGVPALHQGVGPHPHRGFTPVTFVIDGEIDHRDSRGNRQLAKTGEVQWIHSGSGIIHSERPSAEMAAFGGSTEIVQLWINSPSKNKMKESSYQYTPKEEMKTITSNDGKMFSKLIAGNYDGLTSQIKTESELLILWNIAEGGSAQTFKIPKEYQTSIYTIKGEIRVGGHGIVDPQSLIIFEQDTEEQIEITVNSDAQFLLLSGVPINEKVSQYGPYVMNSQTEIMEALRDYQKGKMGILIEEV
ncbi:MAG: pirin family protein [Flavobacteriales bacterium]|nr:pirin family protein [Flavobacteriales bacterium]